MKNRLSKRLVLSALFLFSICLGDLLLCPHSKVEESFNLQASHDLFYYGIGPALRRTFQKLDDELPYDHLQYPGVVPRTFLGPIILSSTCQVIRILLLPILDIAAFPMFIQFLVRFVLMVFNFAGWLRLACTVDDMPGNRGSFTGSWLLIITACQFHLPFYAGRLLPNTFALGIVLHVFSLWIQGNFAWAAAYLVFATSVFRCDLLILLLSLGLSWLLRRQLTILQALKVGILSGLISLIATVPMDSVLWQRLLWPEGEVFYFNTILGKSSEWGTSPWHWYFTSALPKSMLSTIILVPLSIVNLPEKLANWERTKRRLGGNEIRPSTSLPLLRKELIQFLPPITGFLILYSNLGHKEMRFIFPALPILNLAAASSMTRLSHLAFPIKDKVPTVIGRIGFLCAILCLLSTLAGNLIFVAVSKFNYPGGDALNGLSRHISLLGSSLPKKAVNVHIDVASAMSGVSLFGQRAAESGSPRVYWSFNKDGYEEDNSRTKSYRQFTHILSEQKDISPEFAVLEAFPGSPRLNFRQLAIDKDDAIYVLERTTE